MERFRVAVGRVAVAVGVAAATVGAMASPAAAATRFVACDEGESFQATLDAAVDGDVIFVSGTCVGSFRIRKDVTVTGLFVFPTFRGLAASGQLGSVIVIEEGAIVTLQRAKVTGGRAGVQAHSAGVDVSSGTLTMKEVEIFGNHSYSGGGLSVFTGSTALVEDSSIHDNEADDSGGGVFVNGSLTMRRSTVAGNEAETGGGISTGFTSLVLEDSVVEDNFAVFHGGGVASAGSAQISRSIVRGNVGGIWNRGTMTIDRSAIVGNDAGFDPSWGIGGGIANREGATLTIRTSTLAENTARTGGGMHNLGTATLEAVTLSDNTAATPVFTPAAGGLYNAGSFTVRSSVLAGNHGGPNPECVNPTAITSGGSNFAAAACLTSPVSSDRIGTDPGLAALAANGGPTPTLRPEAASPVIDAGACISSVDQRGIARPAGAGCEVGAYENRVPFSPSGLQLTAGGSPNTGAFTLQWVGSADPDGDAVTYRLERRDADDTGYTTVTSVSGTSVALTGQPEGTQLYRVVATDANNDSAGRAGPVQVVVDRSSPATPAITTDREPDHVATDGAPWFADTVDVTVTPGADPLLGDGSPGSGTVGTPTTTTFDTAGPHTVSASSVDAVGNVSAEATSTIYVDTTDPAVEFDTCPSALLLGESATAPWSASDTGVGLAGDAAGTTVLPTPSVGTHSATVTVLDEVGHDASATCTYRVFYDFGGFGAPLAEAGLNTVTAGKVVPVRFSLDGNHGADVLAPGSPTWTPVACDTLAETGAGSSALTDRALQYDARSDQYTFWWSTSKDWKKTCVRLDVALGDGATYSAYVRFK